MSDFYELALLLTIKPDIAPEAVDTLQHIVGGLDLDFVSQLDNPIFSKPVRTVVQPSGVTMRVVPAWQSFFSCGYSEFEEQMEGSFGSSFLKNRLAVRQVTHEDQFFNAWYEIGGWLASISSTSGLVGYYQNLEADSLEEATLIYFKDGQLSEAPVEDLQMIDDFSQSLEIALSSSDT
jgi:hypothetical protein